MCRVFTLPKALNIEVFEVNNHNLPVTTVEYEFTIQIPGIKTWMISTPKLAACLYRTIENKGAS